MIVIAHRYSMVHDADHVIVLSAGEILEQGSPSELISKGGWFYNFANANEVETSEAEEASEEEEETDEETPE